MVYHNEFRRKTQWPIGSVTMSMQPIKSRFDPTPTECACPECYLHPNLFGCLEGCMQCLDVSPQFVLHLSVRNRAKCCFRSNPQANKRENCFLSQEGNVSPWQQGRNGRRAPQRHPIDCILPAAQHKSNKNIPLLVKDLFTEHVHSRFIIWAPICWTIFINITFKIEWHESYCEYLVIRKERNVVNKLGIIISKYRIHVALQG